MSLQNLTTVPKLILVYFSVDKSTCVIKTKKLRMKDGEKSFENKPVRNTVITVKNGGSSLHAMVIATGGKHTCLFADVMLNLIFCFLHLFNNCIFLNLDDVGKLNAEEKVSIEDPANADLFYGPPSTKVTEKKRSRENQACSSGMAKKTKTSNVKVSGRVKHK